MTKRKILENELRAPYLADASWRVSKPAQSLLLRLIEPRPGGGPAKAPSGPGFFGPPDILIILKRKLAAFERVQSGMGLPIAILG